MKFLAPTHVNYLKRAVETTPDAPIFKLARAPSDEPSTFEWDTVTYAEFYIDVQRCAHYWRSKFSILGIVQDDVVSLWCEGTQYTDVVHLLAMFTLGCVPQCFLSHPILASCASELATKASSKAMIIAPSLMHFAPASWTHPQFFQLSKAELASDTLAIPFDAEPFPKVAGGDRIAAILHTSGKKHVPPTPESYIKRPIVMRTGRDNQTTQTTSIFAHEATLLEEDRFLRLKREHT